jgi:DNA-binding protein
MYEMIGYLQFKSQGDNPMAENDVVFVGNKPVMNYVLAVVTQFNNGAKDVRIMARGQAISRAVDVAEVSRSRFLSDVTVKCISISTEVLNTERGETNVSAIEITIGK